MIHLFNAWRQLAPRFRAADSIALFLDFDGTLARLRLRPDEVWLNHATRRVIARLARNPRVRVCIVSGRRLADVRMRIGVTGARYLGLHGWEGRPHMPLQPEIRRSLERAKRRLAKQIDSLPGIRIEDKGPVFTVHYRGASDPEIVRAREFVGAEVSSPATGLRVMEGKKVWEILPRTLGNKGIAVERELNLYGRRGLPVYVGDDVTDEPAFAALPHGVTVRVGSRSLTRARFQLLNVDEVRNFLERLEVELS